MSARQSASWTPQGVGSATTYLRRYSLAALVGIADEEDDDDANDAARPAAKTDDGFYAFEAEHLTPMREAALRGSKALADAFAELPKGAHKTAFWVKHQASLKAAAATADGAP